MWSVNVPYMLKLELKSVASFFLLGNQMLVVYGRGVPTVYRKLLFESEVSDTASAIASLPLFKMAPKSGIEMCFTTGSQHR